MFLGLDDGFGTGGRLVLLVMMLGGMTVFAFLTGTVSAIMVDRLKNTLEANDMQLEELENHIIVCGWNRGGARLIAELGHADGYADRAIVIIAEIPEGETPDIDFTGVSRDRIFLVRGGFGNMDVDPGLALFGERDGLVQGCIRDSERCMQSYEALVFLQPGTALGQAVLQALRAVAIR